MLSGFTGWLLYERGCSPNTEKTHRFGLGAMERIARGRGLTLEGMTRGQLRDCLGDARQRYPNPCTWAIIVAATRQYYRFLQAEGVRDDNPAASLRAGRSTILPQVPPPKDVKRVLASQPVSPKPTHKRDRMAFWIMATCGLRLSEAIGLRLGDIDFDTGFMRVHGKGRKTRDIPMGRRTIDLLRRYLEMTRPLLAARAARRGHAVTDHLFITGRGGCLSMSAMAEGVAGLAEAQGVRLTPHKLRHFAATEAMLGGADIRMVQEFLGHSSLLCTERYLHVRPADLASRIRAALPWA